LLNQTEVNISCMSVAGYFGKAGPRLAVEDRVAEIYDSAEDYDAVLRSHLTTRTLCGMQSSVFKFQNAVGAAGEVEVMGDQNGGQVPPLP
jgi:hypothetical protein